MTSETALSAVDRLIQMALMLDPESPVGRQARIADAARSQPVSTKPTSKAEAILADLEATARERGSVTVEYVPARPIDAARSQPATEDRETFAAVNKALAYLGDYPSEMALAAARATLLSLRAALAATEEKR
jgi:hypothetical protein